MDPLIAAESAAYRRDGGTWLIEMKLRDVRQMFDHLDPAPFRERDLDRAAEAYVEDAIREIGLHRPIRLVVHLPEAQLRLDEVRTLPEAVAHYFGHRVLQTRIELRRVLRLAGVNLAIGLVFLFGCLTLRRSLELLSGGSLLSEGLLIIGWVALWRPVESFLYDWWPILRRIRRLDAARRMPVQVVAAPPG